MTLKEACESGKPFRHKDWSVCSPWVEKVGEFINCPVSQLISDDWEIQEKTSYSKEDVIRASNVLLQEFVDMKNRPRWLEEAMKAAEGN